MATPRRHSKIAFSAHSFSRSAAKSAVGTTRAAQSATRRARCFSSASTLLIVSSKPLGRLCPETATSWSFALGTLAPLCSELHTSHQRRTKVMLVFNSWLLSSHGVCGILGVAVAATWFAVPPTTPEKCWWYSLPNITGARISHRDLLCCSATPAASTLRRACSAQRFAVSRAKGLALACTASSKIPIQSCATSRAVVAVRSARVPTQLAARAAFPILSRSRVACWCASAHASAAEQASACTRISNSLNTSSLISTCPKPLMPGRRTGPAEGGIAAKKRTASFTTPSTA
mmetsp:Transcript_41654/g.110238  ORF Transcript_41654/g.110238 Transcript_41654/m.110238 type:complete len:289 (-) Transcript_41654:166-1032(-)